MAEEKQETRKPPAAGAPEAGAETQPEPATPPTTPETPQGEGSLFTEAVTKLLTDAATRDAFAADPVGTIEKLGVKLDESQKQRLLDSASEYGQCVEEQQAADLYQAQLAAAQMAQPLFVSSLVSPAPSPLISPAPASAAQALITPAVQPLVSPAPAPAPRPLISTAPRSLVNPGVRALPNLVIRAAVSPVSRVGVSVTAGSEAIARQPPGMEQAQPMFVAPLVSAGTRPAVSVATGGTRPVVNAGTSPVSQTRVTTSPVTQTRVTTSPVTNAATRVRSIWPFEAQVDPYAAYYYDPYGIAAQEEMAALQEAQYAQYAQYAAAQPMFVAPLVSAGTRPAVSVATGGTRPVVNAGTSPVSQTRVTTSPVTNAATRVRSIWPFEAQVDPYAAYYYDPYGFAAQEEMAALQEAQYAAAQPMFVVPLVSAGTQPAVSVATGGTRPVVNVGTSPVSQTRVTTSPVTQTRVTTSPVTNAATRVRSIWPFEAEADPYAAYYDPYGIAAQEEMAALQEAQYAAAQPMFVAPLVSAGTRPAVSVATGGTRPVVNAGTSPVSQTRVTTSPVTQTRVTTSPVTNAATRVRSIWPFEAQVDPYAAYYYDPYGMAAQEEMAAIQEAQYAAAQPMFVAPLVSAGTRPAVSVATGGTRPVVNAGTSPVSQTRVTTSPVTQTRVTTSPVTNAATRVRSIWPFEAQVDPYAAYYDPYGMAAQEEMAALQEAQYAQYAAAQQLHPIMVRPVPRILSPWTHVMVQSPHVISMPRPFGRSQVAVSDLPPF